MRIKLNLEECRMIYDSLDRMQVSLELKREELVKETGLSSELISYQISNILVLKEKIMGL